MEPFPKRQRLYAPMERSFPQSFDDHPTYYDELGDDLLDEEDYDEEEEEEAEAVYDPEAELDQKRARLDYKLKSTFESIFEKYERDFEGVGDEIDLETGEIVVNNGHIVRMVDEQDAGDSSRAGRVLREFTQEPDELPSSSLDETEIMDEEIEDEEEDELMSDEDVVDDDMAEDDLILRGFAKANRFQQASQELGVSNAPIPPRRVQQREKIKPSAPLPRPAKVKSLPSRADIMAQFGPQLGPQIVDYVSQQHEAEDRHIESAWRAPELPKKSTAARNIEPAWRIPALPSAAPRRVESAWRVPELPTAAPVRRPVQRLMPILQDEERSPSPEASASIWAPARSRGRRRLDGADNSALFRGESRAPFHGQKSILNPVGYRPSHLSAQQSRVSPPVKKRLAFTAEEDDVLMEWVSKLRRHGHALTYGRWREFEAEHPRHSAKSWQARYIRMFTYLSSNQVEDSDVSNSDVSVENMRTAFDPVIRHMGPNHESDQALRERSTRIRKPAQTDPRILSWNQAVDSIESVDPVLHAGIMEDARRANNMPQQYLSRRQDDQIVDDSEVDTPIQSQEITPPTEIRRSYDDLPIRSSLAVEPTPEEEDFLIPGAPCPHADCKLHPSILYKLQRREHEELSEMCLHLFQVHHTTPFPCGEIGCSKKGEDGYFMQLDLVKHVRRAHKNASALYRLRGRVDPALLKQQAIARPEVTSDPMERPISRQRDSDFMSAQKGYARNLSSSQPAGFDPDRTLTPRGMAGMSTFTPMTSVSSLKVHHPSATSIAVRDMSNSQDRTISDSQIDSSQIMSSQPAASKQTGVSAREPQGLSQITDQRSESEILIQSGELRRDAEIPRNSDPASRAPTRILKPLGTTIPTVDSPVATFEHTGPTIQQQEQTSTQESTMQGSSHVATFSIGRPVLDQNIIEGEPTSIFNSAPSTTLPKQTRSLPPITRNTVNPAYDFSDEELEVRPTTTAAAAQLSTPRHGPKQRAKVPIVPASVSSRPPTSIPTPRHLVELPVGGSIGALKAVTKPLATPGGDVSASAVSISSGSSGSWKKQDPKPAATPAAKIYRRARSEDVDELSLGVDEVILLSSRQRTHPLPMPQIGIKHEELVDSPALLSVPATRKRKLDAIRDHTFDELSVLIQASQNDSTLRPTIKTETDEPSLPLPRPILPKRRGRPSKNSGIAESSSSQIRSSRAPEIMHAITSTPLLDLTPVRNARINAERMKEIGDSEAEGEASDLESPTHRPRQRPTGQTARPVNFGNMSPVTKNRWNRNSLKAEQVSVLVKTPGGTMRRCGVDGFECRRSFCFRCEKEKGEVSAVGV
ncbi:hypothetical protein VTL71DRAFT_5178 [Oculimacula yallundae]|uniref:TERF2-interacting telomeric protein 1 Myb domain-containing protein n=1 Tax=Oculimacula yallundae TaxID=86028 RepID=A0ABR4C0D7_9HELO